MKSNPDILPVWMFSYRKSYYLARPWKWVQELIWGIKNYVHRARYGWSWVDLWNTDQHVIRLCRNMLRNLADRSCGYSDGYFDSLEQYQEFLRDLALMFDMALVEDEKIREKKGEILARVGDGEMRQKLLEGAAAILNNLELKLEDLPGEIGEYAFSQFGKWYGFMWD